MSKERRGEINTKVKVTSCILGLTEGCLASYKLSSKPYTAYGLPPYGLDPYAQAVLVASIRYKNGAANAGADQVLQLAARTRLTD